MLQIAAFRDNIHAVIVAASAALAMTVLAGCVSAGDRLDTPQERLVATGRLAPTAQVLLMWPGGDTQDVWTVYTLKPASGHGIPTVVLGYDNVCPIAADAEAIYRMELELKSTVLLKHDRGEHRNEWFVLSCEKVQDEA